MKRFIILLLVLFASPVFATDFDDADIMYGWDTSTGQFYQTWEDHKVQLDARYLQDAPSDGSTYGRKDGGWAGAATAAQGASIDALLNGSYTETIKAAEVVISGAYTLDVRAILWNAGFVQDDTYQWVVDDNTNGVWDEGEVTLADVSTSINSAIAGTTSPLRLVFPYGIYYRGAGIALRGNLELVGESMAVIKHIAASTGNTFNIPANTSNIKVHGFELDGNSPNRGTTTDATRVTFTTGSNNIDFSFNKIHHFNETCFAFQTNTTTPVQGSNIHIHDNEIYDIGGAGIVFYYYDGVHVYRNKMYKAGLYSCISSGPSVVSGSLTHDHASTNVWIYKNDIDRSAPADFIYNASAEGGGFVYIAANVDGFHVVENEFNDNRNANQDAILTGAHPSYSLESRVYIVNNTVRYAGNYGIDVTSDCVVSGNIVEFPGRAGIAILSDSGNDINNVVVSDNIVMDANEDNSVANTKIIFPILIGNTGVGTPVFDPGGTSASTFTNITVKNNLLVERRETPRVTHAINILTQYDTDDTTTYTGLDISGNTVVGMGNFNIEGAETYITESRIDNFVTSGNIATLTDADATPSVLGVHVAKTANTAPTTITTFDSGLTGQEFALIVGDANTTLSDTSTLEMLSDGAVASGTVLRFVLDGTVWRETGRSGGGAGTGDVVGPASATDNAIARFDSTTGKLIQNSGVTIDDSNILNIPSAAYLKFAGNRVFHETGTNSVFAGKNAGNLTTTGSGNVGIGVNAGGSLTTGSNNMFMGLTTGFATQTGTANMGIGALALRFNVSGSSNTAVGLQAGYNATGSRNVFIGYRAGENETGDDKLYIDNSETATPLIEGDFADDWVRINGALRKKEYIEPATATLTVAKAGNSVISNYGQTGGDAKYTLPPIASGYHATVYASTDPGANYMIVAPSTGEAMRFNDSGATVPGEGWRTSDQYAFAECWAVPNASGGRLWECFSRAGTWTEESP
jgi:hypothetical protein